MASMTPRRRVLLAAALFALGACGGRGPILQQLGPDELYELGQRKMESRDWQDAIRAFEQLTARFPGDPRIEEVRFRIGEAYFGKKDYITAAAEFVRLASDYPSGEYADDARFRTCESYYALSPKPQLDQEYTLAAISHCEALIAYHPQSEYVERARERIETLHDKLARKVYLNGEYYYKRRALDSSILYYEALLRDFPRSAYAPKALLRLVQVYQRLRYREEMEAARDRLLREFPGSEEANLAQEISLANGE